MQQGYGPPPGPPPGYGYQQQPVQPQPPPKKSRLWLWLLLGIGGVLMLCSGLAVVGAMASGEKGTASAGPGAVAPAAQQLPWISLMQGNCDRYKAAPNDIKKSAIFKENEEMLEGTSLTDVRGKLTMLQTDQGGDELKLTVKVGDATFTTESVFSAIKKGSPVYEAAAELTEGQCVVVSASKIKTSSMLEQSKVCDLDFFADFTAIRACE